MKKLLIAALAAPPNSVPIPALVPVPDFEPGNPPLMPVLSAAGSPEDSSLRSPRQETIRVAKMR